MESKKVIATAVHIYTSLGLLFAFTAAIALATSDIKLFFISLWMTIVIDSTDGLLARHFGVKEALPHFDGRRLDDLIDFYHLCFFALSGPGRLRCSAFILGVGSGFAFAGQRLRLLPGQCQNRGILCRFSLVLECGVSLPVCPFPCQLAGYIPPFITIRVCLCPHPLYLSFQNPLAQKHIFAPDRRIWYNIWNYLHFFACRLDSGTDRHLPHLPCILFCHLRHVPSSLLAE